MTEDDKKAWDSHYRFIEQDILSGYWRRYIANPEAYKFAFRAGRDSKGDDWCFDMDKAPRDGTRVLLDTPWGVVIGQWRDEEPASDCARAMIYAGWVSEGGETWPPHNMGDEGDTEQHCPPTSWMLLPKSPPQIPQDKKEG